MATTLAASAAAAAGVFESMAAAATSPSSVGREYFELRAYRLKAGASSAVLDAYFEKALIPALNARGIKAVGVFTEPDAADGPTVWMFIPHPSFESVARVTAEVEADPAVLSAAVEYLTAPTRENPAFARIDSWLMLAFAAMPQHAVPALAREKKSRVFEMRVYESYSEAKARKKVDMFNAGEIDVMRDVDLSPVFYGAALAGSDLPHLAYMLCSADRAAHEVNWKRFLEHPVWLKLKVDPQYADTVSKITRRFLVPTAYSQI